MISAIVAVDENFGIGFNNQLLEHIPEDLKRFKQLTTNKTIIMGRKTWESLPNKPLPNRLNIVITSKERSLEEMTAFIPFEEAYARATHILPEDEWFIIGGGSIYKEFLPICDKVYLTKIMVSHENVDTYFPNIELMDNWKCIEQSEIKQYNDISYQFKTYSRIS